ncbi:DUF1566 domain-containing protein [bacterium]|nr:DUF1566 domain-containing protein [bacterium]
MKQSRCLLVLLLVTGWSLVVGGALAADFTDNGDGTVTDYDTILVWQQGESDRKTWESALTYCEGLTLGGQSDWRLPNFKELQSIVDYTRHSPAINITYFANAFSLDYWSSTSSTNTTSYAVAVNFSRGWSHGSGKGDSYYVRCVRGGQ